MIKISKDSYIILLIQDILTKEKYMVVYDVSKPKHESYIYNVTSPVINSKEDPPILHFSCLGKEGMISLFYPDMLALIDT